MTVKELHGKLIRAEYELSRAGVASSQEEADKPIAVSLELVRECLALLSAVLPAAQDVLAERERQKSVEGWTPEHDDEHQYGDMALAAACYAAQGDPEPRRAYSLDEDEAGNPTPPEPPQAWPWSPDWWKPKDNRRNLVRAGALILAEIERLDRKGGAA